MRMSSLAIGLGVLATTATLALTAVAQTPPHAWHHAAQASAASSGATVEMMRNMQTMRGQMAALQATTDPKRRAKLLDEHLKTMQDTMKLMIADNGGCPAGGMMGRGAMGGNGMMGGGQGRGNMMQMMMEQMQLHQNAMRRPGR